MTAAAPASTPPLDPVRHGDLRHRRWHDVPRPHWRHGRFRRECRPPRPAHFGSWLATTGGRPAILVVTGEQAALFAPGGAVRSGTAREGVPGAETYTKAEGGELPTGPPTAELGS